MTDIRELANRRAATAQAVASLGMINRPSWLSDAIALDARFRLLQDAAYQADREYQEAMKTLSVEDLTAAASTEKVDQEKVDQLRWALRAAKEKLMIYHKERAREYTGGMEYATLMLLIDDCLGGG